MLVRHLDKKIVSHGDNFSEVALILGARQIGKTTLLKRLFPEATYFTCDAEPTHRLLETFDPTTYQQLLVKTSRVLILDEIHLLSNPGRALKLLNDHHPSVTVIATGSSALNIKNKTSESLAGRKINYPLFPLTLSEYLVQKELEPHLIYTPLENIISNTLPKKIFRPYDHNAVLDNLLIYGLYPATLNHQNPELYLHNLVDSVIFRDLTELSLLENKSAALQLLRLLAHQVGSLVNYSELGLRVGLSSVTVKRYLSLFEQSYLTFTLPPYSQAGRDEIGKAVKVYFIDTGLRNALIDNFSPLTIRGDVGALFENFIISDLYKYNTYGDFGYHLHYWRTKQGSEIDLVLSKPNSLFGIEIKTKARRINRAFFTRYPASRLVTVSRDNYWV